MADFKQDGLKQIRLVLLTFDENVCFSLRRWCKFETEPTVVCIHNGTDEKSHLLSTIQCDSSSVSFWVKSQPLHTGGLQSLPLRACCSHPFGLEKTPSTPHPNPDQTSAVCSASTPQHKNKIFSGARTLATQPVSNLQAEMLWSPATFMTGKVVVMKVTEPMVWTRLYYKDACGWKEGLSIQDRT